jgi:hypothetical protein
MSHINKHVGVGGVLAGCFNKFDVRPGPEGVTFLENLERELLAADTVTKGSVFAHTANVRVVEFVPLVVEAWADICVVVTCLDGAAVHEDRMQVILIDYAFAVAALLAERSNILLTTQDRFEVHLFLKFKHFVIFHRSPTLQVVLISIQAHLKDWR